MRRTLLRTVGLGALYLFLAVVATYPLAFHAADHVFGLGTPPLNIWAIAWVNHQLKQDPWALFDGNAFHPYSRSLAFSEHLFVPSLLAAPLIAATGNPVLAYNAVALLSLALAGLGMYLLCRELGADPISSFAAGLFYAFHTWNINELIRLQILSNQWFPFVILALMRFFRQPGVKSALAAGLAYTLQSLSCMYWALYLPFVTLPAVLFMKWRHSIGWHKLLPLGASLGGALLLTAVFAVPYVRNSQAFALQRVLPAAVPVDRYLDVLPGNLLYAEALGTAKPNENAAHFLGFTVMALGALGLLTNRVGPKDREASYRALLTFFCVAGFLLSLGPELYLGSRRIFPGPYALFYHWVPGFKSVRYPERFSLVLVLGLAPLVTFGLTRVRAIAGRGATLLLGAFLFIEHLSVPLNLEPRPSGPDIPQVYRWIAQQPDIHVIAEVNRPGFPGDSNS